MFRAISVRLPVTGARDDSNVKVKLPLTGSCGANICEVKSVAVKLIVSVIRTALTILGRPMMTVNNKAMAMIAFAACRRIA